MSHEPKNTTTISHVKRAVVSHNFIDAKDWAAGIDELGSLSDKKIDQLWEQARARAYTSTKSQSVGIER